MRLLIAALAIAASPAAANSCGPTHIVQSGDTLSGIAARCGVPLAQVFAANPGVEARDLRIGDTINLTGGAGAQDAARALYLAQYLGAYAPTQTCFGQEVQVDLTEDRVFFGETACDITGIAPGREGVVITTTNCRSEGEPSPPRIINAVRSGTGLELGFDGSTRQLERCTDR